jgi:2-methylcitrate dehydratase PrpD
MTLAEQLADWVTGLRYDDLPKAVVASVEDRVMDILGICVAAQDGDAATAARRVAERWAGTEEASMVGQGRRLPAASAALVNGTCAHSLDFDDTHLPSIVHPSAPMVPALLATAESHQATGRDLVVALAAAYEMNTRLSMAQYDPQLGNSVFFERGLHATAMIGAIAGAAGCARLLGANREETMHTIGIAASMGSGLVEANRVGGSVKKFHGGWAAHAAVTAAELAAEGLTGPRTVLEGRFGFFQAYCGEQWRPHEVTAALGERWDTPAIFFKPYPCNHFTHAVADAAFALKARGLRPGDVDHVTIGTAQASWRTIGDPIEEKRHPRSGYHGAFSAPWVFACALAGGGGLGLSTADFADSLLSDPVRSRIAEACDVVVDDECSRVFPHQFPAVVAVRTISGQDLGERVMTNLGGPERPLSRDQLVRKLSDNAGSRSGAIAEACAKLDRLPNVDELLAAVR